VEGGGSIENERQAVAGVELVAIVTDPHVDGPVEHPHLLVDEHVARSGVERHPGARRKLDLDDLDSNMLDVLSTRSGSADARPSQNDICCGSGN